MCILYAPRIRNISSGRGRVGCGGKGVESLDVARGGRMVEGLGAALLLWRCQHRLPQAHEQRGVPPDYHLQS